MSSIEGQLTDVEEASNGGQAGGNQAPGNVQGGGTATGNQVDKK